MVVGMSGVAEAGEFQANVIVAPPQLVPEVTSVAVGEFTGPYGAEFSKSLEAAMVSGRGRYDAALPVAGGTDQTLTPWKLVAAGADVTVTGKVSVEVGQEVFVETRQMSVGASSYFNFPGYEHLQATLGLGNTITSQTTYTVPVGCRVTTTTVTVHWALQKEETTVASGTVTNTGYLPNCSMDGPPLMVDSSRQTLELVQALGTPVSEGFLPRWHVTTIPDRGITADDEVRRLFKKHTLAEAHCANERFLAKHPYDVDANYSRGFFLEITGDWGAALSQYENTTEMLAHRRSEEATWRVAPLAQSQRDLERTFGFSPIVPLDCGENFPVRWLKDDVTLRGAPGRGTAKSSWLPEDLKVEVVETSDGWSRVRTAKDEEGWVRSNLLWPD